MSSLWTPGGERAVPGSEPGRPARSEAPPASGEAPRGPGPTSSGTDETEARLAELRRQLADAPVEAVVANHCYGLFELAALHLSVEPPNLEAARLAVDAMSALVEGLAGRLGDAEATLQDGLAQIRLAFVQVHAAHGGKPDEG